jgi:hypothetical protein
MLFFSLRKFLKCASISSDGWAAAVGGHLGRVQGSIAPAVMSASIHFWLGSMTGSRSFQHYPGDKPLAVVCAVSMTSVY